MNVSHYNETVKSNRPPKRAPYVDANPRPDVIKSALLKAAHLWFTDINTPFSLKAAELVLTDHDALLEHIKSFRVDSYDDQESMRRDYLVHGLLKKANFLNTKFDADARKSRCIDKWVEAERQCAKTNDRLRELLYGQVEDFHAQSVLLKARDFIKRILGPAPKWSALDYRFGPGSTYLVKRQIVPPRKYGSRAVLTPNLLPYIDRVRGGLWPLNDLLVIDGNDLSTVPKDATIDRPIGVEPDMNVYVQLGLGQAIRNRLRPWIDLDTGQDVNRRLVSVAHLHRLSTIDLASASDTVSYMLVMALLPDDWFEMLDACRSPCTTFNGKTVRLEKFSSMGNGYTFELETLIFYALARASGSSEFWTTVYGDDIIVDRESFDNVVMTLEYFGFSVNSGKSFKEGDFFESCGHDYYRGTNVRPVFWKTADKVVDLLKAINDVSRHCTFNVGLWAYRQSYGHAAWNFLRFRLQGLGLFLPVPASAGDVGVISSFDEASPSTRGCGIEGFTFKVVKFKSDTLDCRHWYSAYLWALDRGVKSDVTVIKGATDADGRTWGVSLKGGAAAIPVRDSGSYIVQTGQSHDWPFLGPWL